MKDAGVNKVMAYTAVLNLSGDSVNLVYVVWALCYNILYYIL